MREIDIMIKALSRIRRTAVEKISFADARPLPPAPLRTYLHPYRRLIVMISGERKMTFARDNRIVTMTLRPGNILFAHPGAWVEESFTGPHEIFSAVFLNDGIRFIRHLVRENDDLQNPPAKSVFHTAAPLTAAGNHTLEAILCGNCGDFAAEQNCSALLYQLEAELRQSLAAPLSRQEQSWSNVQEYIQMNLCRDVGRSEIADAVGIHSAALSRLIQKKSGLTLRQYINLIRLEYAQNLLGDDHLTIDEIAMQCGFCYTSYFIRNYRKMFGISPGAGRKTAPGDQ